MNAGEEKATFLLTCLKKLLCIFYILPYNKEEVSFHKQTGLKFKKETSKVLHLEHNIVWC